MIRNLVHVGIAVKDLQASADLFSRLLGIDPGHSEEVPDQKVRTLFFDAGSSGIELLQPTSDDSPIARYIQKRGEGIHHLSFEVDDVNAEIDRLQREGFVMIDQTPRAGAHGYRIAFLHPKSTNGLLVEIGEKAKR